jgi:hypothetical protein
VWAFGGQTHLLDGVFDDHVCLVVLEITKREKDNVSLVDPDLLSPHETKSDAATTGISQSHAS